MLIRTLFTRNKSSTGMAYVFIFIICVIAFVMYKYITVTNTSTSTTNWHTLMRANAAFVKNHKYAKKRALLHNTQNPSCIVLSCADSRVPPELIFNQTLGKLFVVRVAGGIVDNVIVDSIEFAAKTFNVSLIIVLGHTNCGAVEGAVKHLQANNGTPDIPHGHFGAVLIPIERAIIDAGIDVLRTPNALQQATHANIHYAARNLIAESEYIKNAIKEGKLSVIGAEYCLSSGKVTQLFSHS